MGNSKVQLLQEGNSVSTSNCHHVSFLAVTPSSEISTDLWPTVTSFLPSIQVLRVLKLSKKTLIRYETWSKKSATLHFPRYQQQWTCLQVLCGKFCGRHWENSHINLKQSKVLPINTNCVEYNFAIWGQLSINWNPSRNDIIGNILLRIPFPQMTNFRQCK